MIYNTMCSRTDGFGAQFQTIIQSILITESNNQTYLHNTIKNIHHNYDNDPDFLNKIEDLMNLKNNFSLVENNLDKNINILNIDVIGIFENNIDFYMESESLKKIKNIFWQNKIKKFDNNKLNISIHVRRPNSNDNRIEGADTPDKYYLDVIRHLRQLYYSKDILFHIYSQGNIDNFKIYENNDVILHIDENIFDTFNGLVEADILVMSASSFSYSAGILNSGIVYYLPFWHKPYKNWITLNYNLNLGDFINNTSEFTYDDSLRLNKSRIIHLDSLNFNFKYKKILETGCGARGDITNYLLKKYANITLNDVREDNIKSLLNNLNIILPYNTWNLNNNIDENKLFDIIICYGLLYHLTDPENCIKNLSNLCKEYCIISTCTNGKNDESINVLFENDLCMQGLNGLGCRPGRLFIFNTLTKYFEYVYMLTTQPDDIDYPLNFPSEHSSSKNIFIGSHIELNNENLINYLPDRYTLKLYNMDLYFKNINIMNNIKKVKLDIGLSYNAPHSSLWLDNDNDLIVFGFEPDIDSVNCILSKNIIKRDPGHGEPIKNEYINTRFFLMPFALDNVVKPIEKDFYVLKNDCGTSSLYNPHSNLGEINKICKVPVFSLKHFFDIFPWDRFEYIEYIKIDAQGADLNILKSAGDYLKKVIYITAEPEHYSYDNAETNTIENITSYLEKYDFIKINHPNTIDPTYINKKYLHLKDSIYICQCG